MQAMHIFGLAIAVAAVASLMSVSQASAQPVAGATYTGEITGCTEPPCGTVHFTVSGDESQVLGFTAYDVPGNVCEFQGPNPFPIPLDIEDDEDDSFGPGIPGLYEVSGSFPSEGSAEGELLIAITDPIACTTGTLDWTATASFPPPPAVGGIAELPDVSDSPAASYLALAGLAAAALVTLVAGGWYASGRRLR